MQSKGELTNADLKYTSNATGTWVAETVDNSGNLGTFTSLVLDTSDNVYISYYDSNDKDLKYATNTSGSWITETVDSSGDVGEYTSIALDTSGNVHISYYDATSGRVKYATTRTNPLPEIKANSSEGPITLGTSNNLSVTVALDPGSRSGNDADWWAAADTPLGWFYFNASTMSWELAGTFYTDLLVTHQGALFNLSTIEVLDIPVAGLLSGKYILYFAVDMNMNGLLDFDQFYYDSVVVNITP